MENFFNTVPKDIVFFLLTVAFSLLIGLEQRRRHWDENRKTLFGTDRTFAFVGILGYILFIVSPANLLLFISGGVAVLLLMVVFYWQKIEKVGNFGVTSVITVFITYSIAPLLYTQKIWLVVLIVTTVLLLVEMKERFKSLSGKFNDDEFITLAAFLIMSGVILPLLPDKIITPYIPVSPFKFWLAVVVVSGISYTGYILQKFVFPKKGLIITALLGGLYSSTATTIVLARKSKDTDAPLNQINAGIIMATGMMFIRVFILSYIFNSKLAEKLVLPFIVLIFLTFIIGIVVLKAGRKGKEIVIDRREGKQTNPLEFKTALIFAVLFVVFAAVTKFVLINYGSSGLNVLSFIVGVTDIDPFLLSLFMGKYEVSLAEIAIATIIAVTSNNLMKMIYGLSFGSKNIRMTLIWSFLMILVVSVLLILWLF
jgi:uncharacterized membrane protein (DUF4010 family)